MTKRRKKYLIPISPEVERALRHTAVAREMSVPETIGHAIAELVKRDGWLETHSAQSPDEVGP